MPRSGTIPSNITLSLVTDENLAQRAGFIAAYKAAFGGAPYFETYTDEQVTDEVWVPHREHGITVLALDGEQVVGFGCCLPMRAAPSGIQDYLATRRSEGVAVPDFPETWYMSDVGVLEAYRGKGLGTQLIAHRLAHILLRGGKNYIMRTATKDSNSRRIYEAIGSFLLPGIQDVSDSDQVQVNQSQSTQRVYLHGRCSLALARVFTGHY